MKNKLLKAALLHFQAEKAHAEANFEIYLKNSTGIGDHPDIVTEVINLIRAISAADECIKTLENHKEKK